MATVSLRLLSHFLDFHVFQNAGLTMSDDAHRSCLTRLMKFLDENDTHTNATVFSGERLNLVTPEDFLRCLNNEIHVVMDLPPNHNLQPMRTSNTVNQWKKAISFCHPNRLMQWNEVAGVGDLTRSKLVNDLIKKLAKKEVRGQGADPQA